MLLWFVIAYWIISVAIGLWVAMRVHNTADYAAAGHSMPMYVVTATVVLPIPVSVPVINHAGLTFTITPHSMPQGWLSPCA